jgi:hypothetical protein
LKEKDEKIQHLNSQLADERERTKTMIVSKDNTIEKLREKSYQFEPENLFRTSS